MSESEIQLIEKHIKNAWISGIIVSVITTIAVIIGIFHENFKHTIGLDVWALADVVLILLLTFGIYKKNRFCSTALLIYFVLSKLLLTIQSGRMTGGVIAVLFAYFFFQGAKATFQWHKYVRQSGPIEKKKKGLLFYAGVSALSLLAIVIVLLVIVGTMGPGIDVVPGSQLNPKYISAARDLRLLEDDEYIIYWYSDAFLDFKDGFYFFTPDKVVLYSQHLPEPAIIVPLADIRDIYLTPGDSPFLDSEIHLYLNDDSAVFFPVSAENDGDQKFYESLISAWRQNKDPNNIDKF